MDVMIGVPEAKPKTPYPLSKSNSTRTGRPPEISGGWEEGSLKKPLGWEG